MGKAISCFDRRGEGRTNGNGMGNGMERSVINYLYVVEDEMRGKEGSCTE
jgi:hypothetical protein